MIYIQIYLKKTCMEQFKGEENQNQLSSLHNGEAVYKNYFSNNQLQN